MGPCAQRARRGSSGQSRVGLQLGVRACVLPGRLGRMGRADGQRGKRSLTWTLRDAKVGPGVEWGRASGSTGPLLLRDAGLQRGIVFPGSSGNHR